ncbi:MAG: ribosome small subunit-dependent GTPase A [Oscillospiraceae bacterium]|nr:ribosome small subunit-dependent GTPase A [Oscillospiraceae bacterium]
MTQGRIVKALSGFWYVRTEDGVLECRAPGKFRKNNILPLVGDMALVEPLGGGKGSLGEILPRKNRFIRPAVANVDIMVIIASAAVPVTEPYLIDRVAAISELKNCEPVICFNKCDLKRSELCGIYRDAGFKAVETSAVTGEGIDELKNIISGKLCAFTGNSGVGKSSLLNMMEPDFGIPTGDVSEKLGRGRHTTRHVELFQLSCGAFAVDTPGYASFEESEIDLEMKSRLPELFREFRPYLGSCRFNDCAHVSDLGCAVVKAVEEGRISRSRHDSYIKLYQLAKQLREWEEK